MGVPKFYRWLSERYPCLSQTIREHKIPEFDNLYIDMNGIIHPCSHPNDEDPHFQITEEEIMMNIFDYIETLFRIIKPKKNFFMAVDGCAPRAKMNQQRSRRFRTAKEVGISIENAIQRGETLPKGDSFDSNCITPGTEFMDRLHQQLKYFINYKISTDPLWKHCVVHFSGHNVPGEGEHKIMDYIRYCKSKPDYDPNTRHCLYGLDADLIMLGLSVHEPHFCLLREEVRFGAKSNIVLSPGDQVFHLLHLSLLREYLDLEFSSMKESLEFEYDLEKIIDDWIFLGFLVGNDFVPHLPHMHINHDALPYFYSVYKDFLITADGYINEGGVVNLTRLKQFFGCVSDFDYELFAEWKKTSSGIKSKNEENDKKIFSLENPDGTEGFANAFANFSFNGSLQKKSKKLIKVKGSDKDLAIVDEFTEHKQNYYAEKFGMNVKNNIEMQTICSNYVTALQWISHYYFNGLQSWSWYYPYHYSPYMSDLASFELEKISMDLGTPFRPFEQLLAVLPAASGKLLPKAFQNLMVEETSTIIDYYPSDFQTDLNGKKQQYEAVVLIPFIDEKRLLDAMAQNYDQLTEEEKSRNTFGNAYEFMYDENLNLTYPSSHPGLNDITPCKVKQVEISQDLYRLKINDIKKGLSKGAQLDIYSPGFPTLKHLKHKCFFTQAGIKVFKHKSKIENAIIKITEQKSMDIEETANLMIGKSVFVEWPYMVEAMVTSVMNEDLCYYLTNENELAMKMVDGEDYSNFKKEIAVISSYHLFERGINLGDVTTIVAAKLLLGEKYKFDGGKASLVKEWSQTPTFYPLQTIVQDVSVCKREKNVIKSTSDLFPVHSPCVILSQPHYGFTGKVLQYNEKNDHINVLINILKEPNFSETMFESLSTEYVSSHSIAKQMQIPIDVLSRITGDVFVTKGSNQTGIMSYNLGLKIKYTKKNLEMLGYARRSAFGWFYSASAVNLLNEYMKKFPEVFRGLESMASSDVDSFNFSDLFPQQSEDYLDHVSLYLKNLPCYDGQLIRCQSNVLEEPVVNRIEQAVNEIKDQQKKSLKFQVKPENLFLPTDSLYNVPQDREIFLFDRVVNIQNGINVPFGMRGTVIGIHKVLIDENSIRAKSELRYEVLFDDVLLGASVRSKDPRGYILKADSLIGLIPEKTKNDRRNLHNASLNFQWKKVPGIGWRNYSTYRSSTAFCFKRPHINLHQRNFFSIIKPSRSSIISVAFGGLLVSSMYLFRV
ncbi:5'-3' exoribonuclease 1 isoform X1 [Hydra vulgaris]|uniref:5'-3' exoribonuclease 1 isoform X1 n=1 Tax=Hydra vulgaris TaxID=6087 RepID=UPI001F5ECD89|nr:5'-3' exoribonuclease 1 [Hydra vulgaris]